MSDYQHSNLSRSDGISAKGIFITLGAIVVVFLVLAAIGAGTSGGGDAIPAAEQPVLQNEQAPAAASD
ncbi:MAG: hypothetical protein AAF754_09730 [Pseudomonadota bacterium]